MTEGNCFDVIVLGSGFGGSLLATILSREGMSVAMVDRAQHPRFAIGESSTPAADLLLKELASRHDLSELQPLTTFGSWRKTYPDINCGCKRGFSYFWHGVDSGFQATADHRDELLVTANASRSIADTQWYRPDLDCLLADIADRRGVTCLDAADVTDIEHPRPADWTVTVRRDGEQRRLHAKFLIDATGPAGVLMRRLSIADGLDRMQTRTTAIYSHWDNVRPLPDWLSANGVVVADHPFPAQQSAVHHLFFDGWLWQLGFEDGLTSLGFVSPINSLDGNAPTGTSPPSQPSDADVWASIIERHPVLPGILGDARLASFPGRLHRHGRLQRLRLTAAGDDWAALPFTVGFVDPLHSTGIAHTLSAIERLSRLLLTSSVEERKQTLQSYSQNVVDELLHIDRLVAGCYDGLADFRLFTAWSMLYFAAATTFEKRWQAETNTRPGFLCADDEQFVQLVRAQHDELRSLRQSTGPLNDAVVTTFCRRLRDALQPYNHVGLFSPETPHMYQHTSVEK